MNGNVKICKQICVLLLFLSSCSSLKKSMITTGENLRDAAIYNAILDFSIRCNLFKQDSVFHVDFRDSVFNKSILVEVDKSTYKDGTTHIWQRGSLCDGIVNVGIIGSSDYQYYYSEETRANLPSRYIIKDGKLFYWWDSNYPVTEDMINILWKYNLLQECCIIPEFSINELEKGADYYFCKYNLSKYKRVITNIANGHYKPPKLKCNN